MNGLRELFLIRRIIGYREEQAPVTACPTCHAIILDTLKHRHHDWHQENDHNAQSPQTM